MHKNFQAEILRENTRRVRNTLLVSTTIAFICFLCSCFILPDVINTGAIGRQFVTFLLVFVISGLAVILLQFKPSWASRITEKLHGSYANPKNQLFIWASGWFVLLFGVSFLLGVHFSTRFRTYFYNLFPFSLYCILIGLQILISTVKYYWKQKWNIQIIFKPVWHVLDLLIALAMLVLINGSTFPISDHTNMVALAYKLQNPNLYPFDIGFAASPFGYTYFFTQYLNIFSKIFPFSWVMVLSNMLTQLLLLFALRRLASQIGKREIPAIGISLLLLGLGGSDLIAGYHFTSQNYSSHYTAIALALLAISYFLSGRKMFCGLLFILSILFNIRMGGFGVGFVLIFLFWRTDTRKKIYFSIAAAFGLFSFLGFLFWFQNQPANQIYNEIVRIWVFFRSPPHYMPFLFPYKVANLGLIAIIIFLMFKRNENSVRQATCFAALVFIGGITLNIINNSLIFNPLIIIIQFWASAFLVVAFFYVFASIFLAERIERGYIISSLLIFLASDYQTRSLLLLLMMVIDPLIDKKMLDRRLSKDALVTVLSVFLILILPVIIPQGWLEISYNPLPNTWYLTLGIASFIILLIGWRTYHSVIFITGIGCVAAAVITGNVIGIVRGPFSEDKSWVEVTNFAANQTTLDSTFVINPAIDNFQVLAKRSAFVTYKHLPSSTMALFPEWFNRMKMLHVVPEDINPKDINQIVPQDWKAYNFLTTEDFQNIKQKYDFIDYVIVKNTVNLDFSLKFENENFKVYSFSKK